MKQGVNVILGIWDWVEIHHVITFSATKLSFENTGVTAEYPATIVPDSTCAHIFKERDMCRDKLTQVAGYSAVKLTIEPKKIASK